jgi:hypothetical protein
MGLSIFRDVFDLERARQFTERAIDMKMKAQMDPAMKYDNTLIPAGTADQLDPWEMRKRLGLTAKWTRPSRHFFHSEMMKIGAEPFEWIKYIAIRRITTSGMNQLAALAQAKMSTGQEGADDLLSMAGPIVRDICAGEEVPMADVLEMEKYDILQNFDTARVMSYVGPDGVTPETFDFDPKPSCPRTCREKILQCLAVQPHGTCQGFCSSASPDSYAGIPAWHSPDRRKSSYCFRAFVQGCLFLRSAFSSRYSTSRMSSRRFPTGRTSREMQIEMAQKIQREGLSLGMAELALPRLAPVLEDANRAVPQVETNHPRLR